MFTDFIEIFLLLGRAKIESESVKMEQMANQLGQDIARLDDALNRMFTALDQKHMQEILKLNRMEYGLQAALVAKYPQLRMFDPDLPFDPKSNNKALYTPRNDEIEESTADASDEDDDQDMPIDYKMESYL